MCLHLIIFKARKYSNTENIIYNSERYPHLKYLEQFLYPVVPLFETMNHDRRKLKD